MSDERKPDGPFTRLIGALVILVGVLLCVVAPCAWVVVVGW